MPPRVKPTPRSSAQQQQVARPARAPLAALEPPRAGSQEPSCNAASQRHHRWPRANERKPPPPPGATPPAAGERHLRRLIAPPNAPRPASLHPAPQRPHPRRLAHRSSPPHPSLPPRVAQRPTAPTPSHPRAYAEQLLEIARPEVRHYRWIAAFGYSRSATCRASVVSRSAAALVMCSPRWASTSAMNASSVRPAVPVWPRSATERAALTLLSRLRAMPSLSMPPSARSRSIVARRLSKVATPARHPQIHRPQRATTRRRNRVGPVARSPSRLDWSCGSPLRHWQLSTRVRSTPYHPASTAVALSRVSNALTSRDASRSRVADRMRILNLRLTLAQTR